MQSSQHLPSASLRTVSYSPVTKELTVKDLIGIFVRRRAVVAGGIVLCLAAGIALCVLTKREYTATTQLQVQKEQSSQLGLGSPNAEASDAVQDSITLQTQATILHSDSLALKVIRDLKLVSTDDFRPGFNLISLALGLLSPSGPSDAQLGPAAETDLGMSPRERMHVLGVFHHRLKVAPVAGTRMIDVSYTSTNPVLAASVANHLAQALNDYNFETRHDATARTARYLMDQLNELRQQSESLEEKVARAQRESGIVSLGAMDAQGRQQVYSAVLDKLQQATTVYSQAQSNRIAKEAVYAAAKIGDPETISNLSGSSMFSGPGGSSDSRLALVQDLRIQQATLQGQIAELSAKFGPGYPKLEELNQHLDSVKNSIKTAINRLAQHAKSDLEVARGVEESTRKVYTDLKAQADTLNDKAMTYTILHQEAEQSRTLYDTLFKQLKQAGILADFRASNITIVDPARVPAWPAKPRILLYLAAALLAGLLLGACAALLRDALDHKIRNLAELEASLGAIPVAILPFHKESRALSPRAQASFAARNPRAQVPASLVAGALPAVTNPRAPYTEALRTLRTALTFLDSGPAPQVILVTSSVSGEGKTMLSLNLAALLTQHQDGDVLLVEGDLRRPALRSRLNLTKSPGLTSVLTAENTTAAALNVPVLVQSAPGLYVVAAGEIPPNPAELLGSGRMTDAIAAWRSRFAYIVIDSPPVLPVTDSVVLSKITDLTLVVARYNMTERRSVERSCRLLERGRNQKVQVILNAVERSGEINYQYYGCKDFTSALGDTQRA